MIPLNSFRFQLQDGKINLISNDKVKPMFYRYDIDKNHKLAVCTNDSEFLGITHISAKTIWKKFYN